MRKEIKSYLITLVYVCFTAFFTVMCLCAAFSPRAYSDAERRPLAQLPEQLTWEKIADGSAVESWEKFSADQFPLREAFRGLKAAFQWQVLGMKENNGLALQDGYFAKITPEFTEGLVQDSLERLSYVCDKYATGNCWVCIVPDKNYYLGRDHGYVMPDYEWLTEAVKAALPEAVYVDIFNDLTLESFYRTDTHWRQEALLEAAETICWAMQIPTEENYTQHTLEGFKGVYYGQSALQPQPDRLTYLSSPTLVSCTVYDYETGQTTGVYDREKFSGQDGYDVFLGGAKALLRIDNPTAETDRELVVFRDSFGSSMVPLLVQGYKTVYVVDIRYISPEILGNYIETEEKDTLLLYSALILNQKAFK